MAINNKDWVGVKTSTNGPYVLLSLTFFLLMTSCYSVKPPERTVMDTLNELCGASGLRINFNKSKLYASPNEGI